MSKSDLDLLVIGGGVTGLTVAREVRRLRPDWKVAVLESDPQPGGTMRSDRVEGCLCERGPNGFLTNVSFTYDFSRELGLEDRLLPAADVARNRYLWIRGKLRPVPLSPPAFLKSDLLSLRGRLRVLLEPLAGRPKAGHEDSIHDFASRRIGNEAASVLVDAMVAGIHAGDPRELSLEATFPRMQEMEERYGSLMKAMISMHREKKRNGGGGGPTGPGGVLTSFDQGMEVLIQTLAGELGGLLETGVAASGVEPDPEGYRVHIVEDGGSYRTRQLVVATPAHVSKGILERSFPRIAATLDEIPYAGITVACLIYKRGQFPGALDGFGFLIPRGQGPRMLGCIWVGSIFPTHVPEDRVLMRVMIGGSRDPEAVLLPEGKTVDLIHRDLGRILGPIDGQPMESVLYRHPRGIPQYVLGHPGRLRTLDRELESHPGLHLAGNAYRGIGVNDCVREARSLARRITEAAPHPDDGVAINRGES